MTGYTCRVLAVACLAIWGSAAAAQDGAQDSANEPESGAAQTAPTTSSGTSNENTAAGTGQSEDAEQESLKVYFPLGSAVVPEGQIETLERAARTFREGDPFVMIVSGGADTVGPAGRNLELSLQRAQAVVAELAARGIPVGRLQVVGRGTSELEVETGEGVANRQNRVAEITWR